MHTISANHLYLFQTEHGYVLRCACCGRFEVVFGRLLFQLSPERFQTLCARVRSVPFEAWEPESLCAVSLTGLIETCDVCYAYTRTELIELRALLEGAQAMLALEHLVQQTLYPRN